MAECRIPISIISGIIRSIVWRLRYGDLGGGRRTARKGERDRKGYSKLLRFSFADFMYHWGSLAVLDTQ